MAILRRSAIVLVCLALLFTFALPVSAAQNNDFKVRCEFDHQANDDPIVHRGNPGASHTHDFFGLEGVGSKITKKDLAGEHTCDDASKPDPADHSAYWFPALYVNGVWHNADSISAYYVRTAEQPAEVYPLSLQMIGSDVTWTFNEQGAKARIHFPECWDGRGRKWDDGAHVTSLPERNGTCPPSHPVHIPQLMVVANWPEISTSAGVTLSSGDISTMHADFVNGWDEARLQQRIDECLNLPDASCKESFNR